MNDESVECPPERFVSVSVNRETGAGWTCVRSVVCVCVCDSCMSMHSVALKAHGSLPVLTLMHTNEAHARIIYMY